MRASKEQWNLRSRRRRKSFSRLSGKATRGNESRSSRHFLNSQPNKMTSSRLRSLFLFDFSINALFERCSTTIDPSDRRGTFGQNGKATYNIELLFSKRQLARGQTSNISSSFCFSQQTTAFEMTDDSASGRRSTLCINTSLRLWFNCKQAASREKTTIYRVLNSSE